MGFIYLIFLLQYLLIQSSARSFPEPEVNQPPPCQARVDVGFILDSSGSVKNDYGKEKDFIKTIAFEFGISHDGGRAGVVTFSDASVLSIKLDDHTDLLNFHDAVDKIPLMGFRTRIDLALRMAQKSLFTIANGGRPAVGKLLFILTDGSQTKEVGAEDPSAIAQEIRNSGIRVIVVSIGKNIDTAELTNMAGDPKNLFSARSFDELINPDFLKEVNKAGCTLATSPPEPICKAKVDVGFLLDSSGSVKNEYGKEKDFIKALAANFGVSKDGGRASVVTFSHNAEHSIQLNDHFDLSSFSDEVDRIPLMDYTTRIDKALRLTKNNMFNLPNGGRSTSSKLLFVLTDGSQTKEDDAEDPGDIAEELRKQGIRVIVVAIGKHVDLPELINIAGDPKNLFSAASFDELLSYDFLLKVNKKGCDEAIPPPEAICKAKVDVGFILDSSGSVKDNYGKEKEFLKSLASTFGISKDGGRAGVVTFSETADLSVKLNDHTDLLSFNDAVDKIPLMGFRTRLDLALRMAQNSLFNIANGGRPAVIKLLYILTDGAQTKTSDSEDPGDIAEELLKKGIKVIVVSIGADVDLPELLHIAGGPKNLFSATSFDDLITADFLDEVNKAGCKGVTPQPTCKEIAKLDVGFILDSSRSLKDNYGKEKKFLKEVAQTFGISEVGGRAGVVTFSETADLSIKLNDHTDLLSFNDDVDKIPLMGFRTRIDLALRKAQKSLFNIANGGRPTVAKLLFVLTDGAQTDVTGAEDPAAIAEEIRNSGIRVIVIGIGKEIDTAELTAIAGGPKNLFSAATFNELISADFLKKVNKVGCETVTKTPKPICEAKADVGFVLDSSGSRKKEFKNQKEFLKALAATYGINKDGGKVGVVTFSYNSKHSIKLNDHKDLSSFSNAVDKIPLFDRTTRIDKALRLAQTNMFSPENGGRPTFSKLLFILTDGVQTNDPDAEDPVAIAKELRNSGIRLIVISLGQNLDSAKLTAIAGNANDVFSAASDKELISYDFLKKVNKAGCDKAILPPAPTCQAKVDIGFILDSSGSLTTNYGKEKEFLKALASTFGISKHDGRAGVVTFSEVSKHSIKLNDYTDLSSFNNAVDRIPLMGLRTRIDLALRMTQKDMFTRANGGRLTANQILFVLTDGAQTNTKDAEDPAAIAEELRNFGIKVIVIGIGSGIDKLELIRIAGDAENLFSAATFDELITAKFLNEVNKAGCEKAKTAKCKRKVDVGFVLDSSGSLKDNYGKEKEFLKALASNFGVDKDKGRAGVVTFSETAVVSVKLDDHTDLLSFNNAVDKIPLMGFRTRIDLALRMTQKKLFNLAYGGRPSVNKILFVLTDGSQTKEAGAEDPGDIAEELRESGIKVIVVSIGADVDLPELLHIAGNEKSLFSAASFDELITAKFLKDINNAGCDEVTKPFEPTCKTKVDVGFVLDSSGSVENDYDKEKGFVKTLAASFGIDSDGGRAGVVTFSYNTEHSIKLNAYTDLSSFNSAVDRIAFFGRTTRIDKALRKTQRNMFSPANGGRPTVVKLLFVLTDGAQTNDSDAEDPGPIAEEIRKSGIRVIVIGIGKGIDKAKLAEIAGDAANMFSAASFNELVSYDFVKEVSKAGCEVARRK